MRKMYHMEGTKMREHGKRSKSKENKENGGERGRK